MDDTSGHYQRLTWRKFDDGLVWRSIRKLLDINHFQRLM
jgi:hypothetical protein